MAEQKKPTSYQLLNKLMNQGFNNDNLLDTESTYQDKSKDPKVIIRGKTPQDIKRKALELEQQKTIREKFFKSTERGFQKALQYEAARLPAYMDYEGMEYYPLIASALDLFMEEATTFGPNGKMLEVFSEKERIKEILDDLFYNKINVNVNLPFWTRNTVKYGDNFVLLYGEKGVGLSSVKQLVNFEIERIERVENGKVIVKFKDRMTGVEFNAFEVAHFRLLGDDKYIPYGSSVLNKIRRVFRQLVMAEDAMLTYRIIRAGEKKVYKIDVGNIDEDDIEEYVMNVATKLKRVPQVNPTDGQIDYRFNILNNDEDIFLPVRNNNSQTGVDTLPGANNLNDINDIEYLRDNLFMGLGIPKPFLSFQDASGGGKNFAQYDIRFAKKISRIQQTMIQELNKIAIIHLFLMGYRGDELTDFTLRLANPSTQQELLIAQLLREKAQTYTELTRGEGGIAAMSHTEAKRRLFNMSDAKIVQDLKEQKMEKVIMQELADSPVIIKKSGLFKDIDDKYSEEGVAAAEAGEKGEEPAGGMEGEPPAGGEGEPMGGGQPPAPVGGGDIGVSAESTIPKKTIDFEEQVNKLVYGEPKKEKPKSDRLIVENDKMVKSAQDMIKEINNEIGEDINEKDDLEYIIENGIKE
ncbi:MAG: portal protein [bacterium]